MQDSFELIQNRQGWKIVPSFKVLNVACGHFHFFRHPFLRQFFSLPQLGEIFPKPDSVRARFYFADRHF